MRGYLVAGNWKMNGSKAANAELVDGIVAGMPQSDSVELLICPPFPYLAANSCKIVGNRCCAGRSKCVAAPSGCLHR